MLDEVSVFDVAAYIPEALLPQYEALRDGLKSVLALLGVGPKDSTDSSAGMCVFSSHFCPC